MEVILSFLVRPAAIVGGLVSFYLAIYVDFYFAAILLFLPLLAILLNWRRRARASRRRADARKKWLQTEDEEHDFDYLREEFWDGTEGPHENVIDDWTWNDLDIDALFARIDRTFTVLGERSLYAMLRTPEVDLPVLSNRAGLLHWLQTNDVQRESIQIELLHLGKTRRFRMGELWSNFLENRAPLRIGARILSVCAGLSLILLLVLQSPLALILSGGIVMTNFVLSSWFGWLVYWHTGNVIYARTSIATAGRIALAHCDSPDDFVGRLALLAQALSPVCKKSRFVERFDRVSIELIDLPIALLRGAFLLDLFDYFKLMPLIQTYRAELTELLTRLGELDALQSITSFRARLGAYSEPTFGLEKACLEIADCRHPLVSNSVTNSFIPDDKNAFITGSNRSGKTTFLRAVAVNVIMAQTLCTVCAAAYKAPVFRIASSIENMDDLLQSKSFYQAEAERLLCIINAANRVGAPSLLCILDEPLKGTNSQESISATIEILNYLAQRPALIMVASHHVGIAKDLPAFDIYHFPDPLQKDPQQQNYRLMRGLDYEHNGIKLLEHLGFPADIVQAALERMRTEDFLPPSSPSA